MQTLVEDRLLTNFEDLRLSIYYYSISFNIFTSVTAYQYDCRVQYWYSIESMDDARWTMSMIDADDPARVSRNV